MQANFKEAQLDEAHALIYSNSKGGGQGVWEKRGLKMTKNKKNQETKKPKGLMINFFLSLFFRCLTLAQFGQIMGKTAREASQL